MFGSVGVAAPEFTMAESDNLFRNYWTEVTARQPNGQGQLGRAARLKCARAVESYGPAERGRLCCAAGLSARANCPAPSAVIWLRLGRRARAAPRREMRVAARCDAGTRSPPALASGHGVRTDGAPGRAIRSSNARPASCRSRLRGPSRRRRQASCLRARATSIDAFLSARGGCRTCARPRSLHNADTLFG